MSKSWDAFKQTTPELLDGGMVVWRGLFTPRELDALEQQCDALMLEEAKLNAYGVHPIRATKVAWVTRAPETQDLYHRMEAIVLRLNAEHFRADLSGLSTMQYAVYRQAESGHFDWHNDYGRDRGDPGHEPRKLTSACNCRTAICTTAAIWKRAPRIRWMWRRARAARLSLSAPTLSTASRRSRVVCANRRSPGPEYR